MQLFFGRDWTNAPNIEVQVAHWPNAVWLPTPNSIQDDVNPVVALWDLWTNPRYGLGLPESRLDRATLAPVGERLNTEDTGFFNADHYAAAPDPPPVQTVFEVQALAYKPDTPETRNPKQYQNPKGRKPYGCLCRRAARKNVGRMDSESVDALDADFSIQLACRPGSFRKPTSGRTFSVRSCVRANRPHEPRSNRTLSVTVAEVCGSAHFQPSEASGWALGIWNLFRVSSFELRASDILHTTRGFTTCQGRAFRPLAPLNLRVFSDGHNPTYATGADIVVDWDQAASRSSAATTEA